MTFWHTVKASYTGSIAFIIACPALIAIPILLEMAQHVIEVHQGMYDSLAAAQIADGNPIRLAAGLLKVAAITLSSYWVVRFLAWGDPKQAGRMESPAAHLFAGVLAFQVGLAAIQLFALPRTGSVLLAEAVGQIAMLVLLAAWSAAASLGNARIGPIASIGMMAPQLRGAPR